MSYSSGGRRRASGGMKAINLPEDGGVAQMLTLS